MAIKKICSRCKKLVDKTRHGYCEECYSVIVKEKENFKRLKHTKRR
jgi:predicted amidophosphoribosyltransferase